MGVFLKGRTISNIFWGAWNSWYLGEGRTVDAGPEPTYEEKMRVPPPTLGSYLNTGRSSDCVLRKYHWPLKFKHALNGQFVCVYKQINPLAMQELPFKSPPVIFDTKYDI